MVDIHCHILPEVDDGASSWEVAEEMCRMAVADGITHIVASPHANHEFLYDREQHEARARQLVEKTGGAPAIVVGCDCHFSYENLQEILTAPGRYTIGNTRYLLVELSDYSIPPTLMDNFRQLLDKGLRPILTHPERNPLLQQRREMLLRWVEEGIILQITGDSLNGRWGRLAQKVALWLLKHRAVHVVATDAHDEYHRPPLLSPARRILAARHGEDLAQVLVEQNPAAILRGESLPYFPIPV